jgi:hypothetical protein
MRMRAVVCAAVLGCGSLVCPAAPKPVDWVPVRWPWTDAASLDLLAGSPVNCLLLENYTTDFVAAARARGLVTLVVLGPSADAATAAKALAAKVTGVALEGEYAASLAAAIRQAAGNAPVIEITTRNRIPLGSQAPILATFQGVWPGVAVQENGSTRAGPSGSAWIDTNTGFLRAVRAWGDAAVWVANRPPAHTVIPNARYLQAIADAAASGARWVVAFDSGFAARLHQRDADAIGDWHRMSELLGYFEAHPEWRAMREYGQLAIVQDPEKGGLLSGGILDMIAVRHTPVRAIPRQHLTAESLAGATMAVDVDAGALTPEQKDVLKAFARSGGMVLTGPPGWQDSRPEGNRITLDQKELDRLNDIWHDVNSMVGRRNLGVRLFNVSSMLSNLLTGGDGKTVVLHLVNYSDYPVEDVTVHFMGKFSRAMLLTPGGSEKKLEIYPTEDGGGVDLDKVAVCATVRLEQ